MPQARQDSTREYLKKVLLVHPLLRFVAAEDELGAVGVMVVLCRLGQPGLDLLHFEVARIHHTLRIRRVGRTQIYSPHNIPCDYR